MRDLPRDAGPTGNAGPSVIAAPGKVGPTVIALGSVSLLTDISSEMITAILPIYLTLALGLSPLAFGVIDGLYQGVTVLVRLASGYVADRFRRPKAVAGVGYGLSAACKLGLIAAAGQPGAIGAVLAIDRTGKGLRTAPRDALLSASVDSSILGRAFGVHRAMDTVGAMLGPLLAFALLLLLPGDYDAVFVASFVFALLGCAALWAFVQERPHAPNVKPIRFRDSAGLVRQRRFRMLAIVSGGLALLTVSDGFLYLSLRDREAVDSAYFPLLFLGTAAVYLALAVPLGRIADRIGRTKVLVGGHASLLGAYLLLLSHEVVPSVPMVGGVLVLLGIYYAATDGVLSAIAASLVPDRLRTSGIAVVQTAVAGGRLLSAILFGFVWTVSTQSSALIGFSITLFLALPVAAVALRRCEGQPVETSQRGVDGG